MQHKVLATLLACLIVALISPMVLSTTVVPRCSPHWEGKSFSNGCRDCSCIEGEQRCSAKLVEGPCKEQPAPKGFWVYEHVPVPEAKLEIPNGPL